METHNMPPPCLATIRKHRRASHPPLPSLGHRFHFALDYLSSRAPLEVSSRAHPHSSDACVPMDRINVPFAIASPPKPPAEEASVFCAAEKGKGGSLAATISIPDEQLENKPAAAAADKK
mmetsp:Transcript_12094/g.32023  ORF Transcript_12094/g.32023 Transcript_12094/m.32023 type:complete len:120 (-) Transcript_12094:10-369(-)